MFLLKDTEFLIVLVGVAIFTIFLGDDMFSFEDFADLDSLSDWFLFCLKEKGEFESIDNADVEQAFERGELVYWGEDKNVLSSSISVNLKSGVEFVILEILF